MVGVTVGILPDAFCAITFQALIFFNGVAEATTLHNVPAVGLFAAGIEKSIE